MAEEQTGVIGRLHQQFEITFPQKEEKDRLAEEQGDAVAIKQANPEHQKQPTLHSQQQKNESIPIADISPSALQSIPEQPPKPQEDPDFQLQSDPIMDHLQQPQQMSIPQHPQTVSEEEEHLEMTAMAAQQMYHEPEGSKLCHSHLHQQETAESHEEDHLSDIRHCSPVLYKNRTEPNELVTLEQLELDQGKPLNLEMSTEEAEHQELMSYRALTEKFQMALSRSKHTVSSSDFAARQDDYLKKKKSDIDHLRKEKDQLQKSRCSGKPLINSRSQQLLGYRPIQRRYKEVLKEKQKKVEAGLAEKKRREEEEQEKIVKEMEEHQQKVKSKIGTVRTKEAYYGWMQTWSEERNKKVEELAARRGQNTQQDATFKPQLNEKSQAMMRKKVDRVPIYQKQPVARKVGVDKNCTFKPNLNKTIKK